ncbi:hypothetical protein M758_9G056400 [Ceratodon purpureus]|nr:hypothetical protein M758_9G056400 [Ceratodon purpureus]
MENSSKILFLTFYLLYIKVVLVYNEAGIQYSLESHTCSLSHPLLCHSITIQSSSSGDESSTRAERRCLSNSPTMKA